MTWLDRIAECNNADPGDFVPLIVAGQRVGGLRPAIARRLCEFSGSFAPAGDGVALSPDPGDAAARTRAVDSVIEALRQDGAVGRRKSEAYPVARALDAPALLEIDRSAVPLFGIRAWGVHMNGYLRDPYDGAMKMWIGRRARDKENYPGLLDNMVAGGLPAGLSPMDNLVKECAEEADIPEALARRAVPAGAISYFHEAKKGLKPDVQLVYDLEVPADFVPRNTDGELESFTLLPIAEVAEIVRETREFKFNCALVIIDFLVRHGLLGPDEPGYPEIVAGLGRAEVDQSPL